MQSKNILLLTDVFPCNNYSGGIVSQQLCYFLLEENCNIFCALIKNPTIMESADEFTKTHINTLEFIKPNENANDKQAYLSTIKKISKKILQCIMDNHIETIWCPIQGETILLIFDYLQKKLKRNVRFVSQIWDPIEWQLHELSYSQADTRSIQKTFQSVLSKSDYILTPSHAMNRIFKYHGFSNSSPIFSSYRQVTYFPPQQKKDPKKYIIFLAGQTYAKKSLVSLISALDSLDWKYLDKTIEFHYYGPNYEDFLNDNPHIHCFESLPQDILIEREKQADLLYCPYYFEDNPIYAKISAESYPSKVTTYIPSHTPILIHADKNSSIYRDFEEHECGFLLDSLETSVIAQKLKAIIDAKPSKLAKILKNADKLFEENFTRERNKKVFLTALNIPYTSMPSYRILEVNNLDLPGKRWNGYDIAEYTNHHTHNLASQIVTYKTSNNKDVFKIFSPQELQLEQKLLEFEANQLSVHSCLSCSSPNLLERDIYKNADVVHLHLIHNMKLSLISLIEICNKKPTVITIHDPWTFTGRCVWTYDCKKYLTGCHNCPNLNTLFPLKCDNCHELWELKKFIYDRLDVDYVVTTKYMANMFNESPLTKGKRVHVIPFGIRPDEFYNRVSQEEARQHYNIPKDHIVIFHRAQFLSKGTEYVIEALKELQTDKKITIITCSEKNRLNAVKNKYNIIDLGDIKSDELVYAYNACDFFLSPSIGESFCMMAVEAMSCAKPVIIFDNTALPDVTFAPECGVMAKDRDSHDLMVKIKWMIEDEDERKKRGKIARELACKHYDLDTYNNRIQALYAEVATRKHNYTNYQEFLNRPVKDTDSVIALKTKLNSLSKTIFPKGSTELSTMLYPIPKLKNKSTHIAYGDQNTQLLINNYNNMLHEQLKTFDPDKLYGSPLYKLLHKLRTFFHMLTNDRGHIVEVAKKRLHITE